MSDEQSTEQCSKWDKLSKLGPYSWFILILIPLAIPFSGPDFAGLEMFFNILGLFIVLNLLSAVILGLNILIKLINGTALNRLNRSLIWYHLVVVCFVAFYGGILTGLLKF